MATLHFSQFGDPDVIFSTLVLCTVLHRKNNNISHTKHLGQHNDSTIVQADVFNTRMTEVSISTLLKIQFKIFITFWVKLRFEIFSTFLNILKQ